MAGTFSIAVAERRAKTLSRFSGLACLPPSLLLRFAKELRHDVRPSCQAEPSTGCVPDCIEMQAKPGELAPQTLNVPHTTDWSILPHLVFYTNCIVWRFLAEGPVQPATVDLFWIWPAANTR